MSNNSINILLIEDNPGDSRLIREILSEETAVSYTVKYADRLSLGLETAAKENCDLILLDLGLPDSQGIDTIRRIKAKLPDKPIVVLTGLDDKELAMKAMHEGAQDYLIKGKMNNGEALWRIIRYSIERSGIEQKLRYSEAILKEAQSIGKIGHWEFDLATNAIEWSDQVYRLYGRDKALGPPSVEEEASYYHPEEAARLKEFAHLAIEKGEEYSYDLKAIQPGGNAVFLNTHIRPVKDAEGHIIKLMGTIQDITERKQMEEDIRKLNAEQEERVIERTSQLTAANKDIEAFAYSVSHDLRAPLRGIDGWSLALLEDYKDKLDEQGKQYLSRIRTETLNMGQLIDDLLMFSRQGRSEMKRRRLDMTAMAQAIVSRLQQQNPAIQADFVIQPGLMAQGDTGLIEIVLDNLLANAFKFSSKNPHCRIEFGKTAKDGDRAFFVRDNGVGFDMAYADKLFGVFQRLHKSSEFPGTGIGLATAQRIINRHGGRIWAEAQVNRGATFYFTLKEEAA
jgi:PAS domain S-box-containing protein